MSIERLLCYVLQTVQVMLGLQESC